MFNFVNHKIYRGYVRKEGKWSRSVGMMCSAIAQDGLDGGAASEPMHVGMLQ